MKKLLLALILVFTMVPSSVYATNPVTMTTDTQAQVTSLGVSVDNMTFHRVGSLLPVVVGTDSDVETFIITNTGNVPITVTALIGGGDASFYSACLYLDSGSGYGLASSWSHTTPIAPNGTVSVNAKIHPSTVGTGFAGTITFIGTYSP